MLRRLFSIGCIVFALVVLCIPCCTHAQSPLRLYNTGVDDNGTLLTGSAVDPHYVLLSTPSSTIAALTYPVQNVPSWGESLHAKWIAPQADVFVNFPAGTYVYRTTFDLAAFNPTTAVIDGHWAADNWGVDILINGQSTGHATIDYDFLSVFRSFRITTGFQTGLNTLDFVLYNNMPADNVNPTGLLVEITGTAEAITATVSGHIQLQGAVNQAQPVTFDFRPIDGSNAFARTVTLNADQTFHIEGIPLRSYNVNIKGAKWLAKTLSVDTTSGNVSNVNLTLLTGDATDDNFVDINDLLLLITHYNQFEPASGYLEAADFNIDGADDIFDLILIISNYNKQGDS